MNIASIGNTILDESSSPEALQDALKAFVQQCSEVTGIVPDPGFDAWAQDSLLEDGVAINPNAAAHCAIDYQRSTIFIRGVYAAIQTLSLRFPDTPLEILYAGCGPFATLLMPILGKFSVGDINLTLLDIHPRSIDSVELLLAHFGLNKHKVRIIVADACHYQHDRELHLAIAETMQKALEQEPQFAVTANLAPQVCARGVFIPQRIEISLCLADLESDKARRSRSPMIDSAVRGTDNIPHPLASVCTLTPGNAAGQIHKARQSAHTATMELQPTTVTIPPIGENCQLEAALFTRIAVYEHYCLEDYESEITLPLKCHELAPLTGGACYRISYQLGAYPRFDFEYLD